MGSPPLYWILPFFEEGGGVHSFFRPLNFHLWFSPSSFSSYSRISFSSSTLNYFNLSLLAVLSSFRLFIYALILFLLLHIFFSDFHDFLPIFIFFLFMHLFFLVYLLLFQRSSVIIFFSSFPLFICVLILFLLSHFSHEFSRSFFILSAFLLIPFPTAT